MNTIYMGYRLPPCLLKQNFLTDLAKSPFLGPDLSTVGLGTVIHFFIYCKPETIKLRSKAI